MSLSSQSFALVLATWEGNCGSGIALAMRHRQQWYYHLRAHGLGKRDEHPTYASVEYGTLYNITANTFCHLLLLLVLLLLSGDCLSFGVKIASAVNIINAHSSHIGIEECEIYIG